MHLDNNQNAFLELVKAGLWEKEAQLSQFGKINFSEVYQLADEQSVIGLVAAGIDHVEDVSVPQKDVLQFIGTALQLEQQNKAMNEFVATLIEKLRKEDIYAILFKGQGIAQCYEKPLWRSSGDIDLLLDEDNYEKAKNLLLAKAQKVEKDYNFFKHVELTIDGWIVELHGTFHGRLSDQIDYNLDLIQDNIIKKSEIRAWHNGNTRIDLPNPDNDVVLIFAHILHHFFFEGVGLRQICDWCRLLWTFHKEIDIELLEYRLCKMALMTEWKAFSAYAVEYLGIPREVMPLYTENIRWSKKAEKINRFVMKVGNFGHNQVRNPFCSKICCIRSMESLWIRLGSLTQQIPIFPKDSILFFLHVLKSACYTAYERSRNERMTTIKNKI